MTDYFTLLNEPRRPWLDTDKLKTKFLELSAVYHPDRYHSAPEPERLAANQRFAEINAAYNCLRDPKERLGHLLALELGAKPKDIQRIPPGTMELFVEVGQACRDADQFLADKDKAKSALLKAQLFEKGAELVERLSTVQSKIAARHVELLDELRNMNQSWEFAPDDPAERIKVLPLERIEQIYRGLSYLNRWTEQIQERLIQLSF